MNGRDGDRDVNIGSKKKKNTCNFHAGIPPALTSDGG
jgi:hypothetical protein